MFITGESILPLLSIYHRGVEIARYIPPGSRDRSVYTTRESRPLGVYHRGVETARCIPPGSRDRSVYTTGESRPLGVYHRGVETARCVITRESLWTLGSPFTHFDRTGKNKMNRGLLYCNYLITLNCLGQTANVIYSTAISLFRSIPTYII
jgi:hypothetical protein